MNRLSFGVQDNQKFKLMAVLAHPDDESLGLTSLTKALARQVVKHSVHSVAR
jgi:LmbE family N-acetylglucosaminyl deacetylase